MHKDGCSRARGYHEQATEMSQKDKKKKKKTVNKKIENTKRIPIEILELRKYHNWNVK